MSVVKISINKLQVRPTEPYLPKSVVVEGVLLRSPAVFVRVGLLSLALERAIGHSTRQSSGNSQEALTAASISCARAKLCPGGAEAIQYPCAERGGTCNVRLQGSWVCSTHGELFHLLDTLLGPFQIPLCLSCGLESFREIRPNALQTTLSEGLQF